ncbi:hypothetical protein U1Q18_021368 [Sarracenia purpurea var. burkii]
MATPIYDQIANKRENQIATKICVQFRSAESMIVERWESKWWFLFDFMVLQLGFCKSKEVAPRRRWWRLVVAMNPSGGSCFRALQDDGGGG